MDFQLYKKINKSKNSDSLVITIFYKLLFIFLFRRLRGLLFRFVQYFTFSSRTLLLSFSLHSL